MSKLVVFVLRAQPFHNGHHKIVKTAFESGDHVLLLLGSAQESRTDRNPYTVKERTQMIRNSVFVPPDKSLVIMGIEDYPDDKDWFAAFNTMVNDIAEEKGCDTIAIIGHTKDETSNYLYGFDFEKIFVPNYRKIDATAIRKHIKEGTELDKVREMMPLGAFEVAMSNKHAIIGAK